VSEAAITGESAPVIKEPGTDIRTSVTGGTTVVSDWLRIRISANPGETFLDRMIALVEGAERQKTPNEIALNILLAAFTIIFLLAVGTIRAYANYLGGDVTTTALVALLVCLIPTTIGGLLSAIGIAGMDRMVQRNVLAVSGKAVETAGDIDTLLLDKTGTITFGNRLAAEFIPVGGHTEREVALAALQSSLADETPEGKSIVDLAHRLGHNGVSAPADAELIPFTAETRMSGIQLDGRRIMKGAVDAVGRLAKAIPSDLEATSNRIAMEGGTPLGVVDNDEVLGVIYLKDTVKPGIRAKFEEMRRAGIRTIMITGDYPNTAHAIAETIGMLRHGRGVMTGAQLDTLSDDNLRQVINETSVFARVSPEHKMRIVDALQANGEVVAMTGDGVNDAPAIKRADIGVAMGITGTDVAKETADMVLTDDNYASIVAAVEQGRIIYSNIRKFVFFLLSSNIAEIMIIFLATLAGLPAPLTAIQLLWLNLITDGAPALALAVEKGDPDIMQQKPRAKNEPIVNRSMSVGLVVQTIAQTAAVLTAFGLGLVWHLEAGAQLVGNPITYIIQHDWLGVDVQTAETMAFVTLSLAELFRAYTVRSERASLFSIGVFSNRYMQYAVGLSITLLLLVTSVPFLQPIFNTHFLSPREWGVVVGLALIPAVAEEITKFFLRMKR
jgi:high-affinity K+ transport system ATPase subunit B